MGLAGFGASHGAQPGREDHVEHLQSHGYAVVRQVFSAADIAELAAAFDHLEEATRGYDGTYRDKNFLVVKRTDARLGSVLRMVQWPSYSDALFARYRVDHRLFELIEPMLGRDIKQIANQCMWKRPGSTESGYLFHQDARFRRPTTAYRELATSYLQTYIAIDPQRRENGCLRVYPGSHTLGLLPLHIDRAIMDGACGDDSLRACGLDPDQVVDLELDPGDVVLWTPFLIHGSHRNTSTMERRTYVNGYMTAANTDRGEWAFRDGQPCALGDPVLVQYDDLYTHAEPHYVEGAIFPYRPG